MQIIVLGMHRSGTSAVTRLINMMGPSVGSIDRLQAPNKDNPKGFWERDDVKTINDQLLLACGSSWYQISNFEPAQYSLDKISKRFGRDLSSSLHKIVFELDAVKPWVVKDPRLCLLLSYWKPYFETPLCIFVIRNPLEVAKSLRARNGFPLHVGLALWEKYNLLALCQASGIKTILVQYNTLLDNPIQVTKQLYNQLSECGLSSLQMPSELAIKAFLDQGLYTQHRDLELEKDLLNTSQQSLYNSILSGTFLSDGFLFGNLPELSRGAHELLKEFDTYIQQLNVYQRLFKEKKLSNQLNKYSEQRLEIEKLKATLALLECERSQAQLDVDFLAQCINALDINLQSILNSSRFKCGDLILERWFNHLLKRPNRNIPWAPEHARAILNDFHLWYNGRYKNKRFPIDHPVSAKINGHATSSLSALAISQTIAEFNHYQTQISVLSTQINLRKSEISSLNSWLSWLSDDIKQILSSQRWKLGSFLVNDIFKRIVFSQNRTLPWAPQFAHDIITKYQAWLQLYNSRRLYESHSNKNSSATNPLVRKSFTSSFTQSKENICITQFTPPRPQNPYYTMIPDALMQQGWRFEFCDNMEVLNEQIAQDTQKYKSSKTNVVHFHQLEPYYHSKTGNINETESRAQQLLDSIIALKRQGAKLVWTQHNPLPHDRAYSNIDRKLRETLSPVMDQMIVHGQVAKKTIATLADKRKIHVIPIPSFEGHYGPIVPQATARERLNLEHDLFLFGHIGHIKPYKGIETIIQAMSRLEALPNNMRAGLLIAGQVHSKEYLESLQTLVKTDSRIIFRPGLIEDSEIPTWMGALNSAVFAFNDIWGSSSLMLALTYQVPVVAPRRGCIEEYVQDENTGFLYEHKNVEDLAQAMLRLARSPLRQHIRYMSSYVSEKLSATNLSEKFGDVYLRAANEI